MAKAKQEVGVDSGLLLIIDPCYLIDEENWKEVGKLAARYGDTDAAWRRAVLEVLGKMTGQGSIKRLGTVVPTGGDGRFGVRRWEKGIFIETY
jgi:hypothetical protein